MKVSVPETESSVNAKIVIAVLPNFRFSDNPKRKFKSCVRATPRFRSSENGAKTIENGAETKHLNSTRTARPPKWPGSSSRIQMLKSSRFIVPGIAFSVKAPARTQFGPSTCVRDFHHQNMLSLPLITKFTYANSVRAGPAPPRPGCTFSSTSAPGPGFTISGTLPIWSGTLGRTLPPAARTPCWFSCVGTLLSTPTSPNHRACRQDRRARKLGVSSTPNANESKHACMHADALSRKE